MDVSLSFSVMPGNYILQALFNHLHHHIFNLPTLHPRPPVSSAITMFRSTLSAMLAATLVTTSISLPTPAPLTTLPDCPPAFVTSTAGIPAHDIAALFSKPTFPHSPSAAADIEQIRATIALYGLALDGKNFAMLDHVFTADVRANYSALGVMSGVEQLKTTLETSLEPVASTQHQFGTSVVQLCRDISAAAVAGEEEGSGRAAAVSVTYTTTSHFPRGPAGVVQPAIPAADVITGFIMYQDVWVKEGANENESCDDDNGTAGTSEGSHWRIRARNTVTMVRSLLSHCDLFV